MADKDWQTACMQDGDDYQFITGYKGDIVATVKLSSFLSDQDRNQILTRLDGNQPQHELDMSFGEALTCLFGCRAMMQGRVVAPNLTAKAIRSANERKHYLAYTSDQSLELLIAFDAARAKEAIVAIEVLSSAFPIESRHRWDRIFYNIVNGGDGKVSQDRSQVGRKKGSSKRTRDDYREIAKMFWKSGLTQAQFLNEHPLINKSKLQRALRESSKKLQ